MRGAPDQGIASLQTPLVVELLSAQVHTSCGTCAYSLSASAPALTQLTDGCSKLTDQASLVDLCLQHRRIWSTTRQAERICWYRSLVVYDDSKVAQPQRINRAVDQETCCSRDLRSSRAGCTCRLASPCRLSSSAQYTAGCPKKIVVEICILVVFCTLRRPHLGILRHTLEISPMSSQLERTISTPILTRRSPILLVILCKMMRDCLLQRCTCVYVFLRVITSGRHHDSTVSYGVSNSVPYCLLLRQSCFG